MPPEPSRAQRLILPGAIALLLVLFLELSLSITHETQTWDEACHIFAGYSYWTRGDFGMNPEHPPFVKLLATAPLLSMPLQVPPHPKIFSKEEDFTSATRFVYDNDAEKIMFRTRIAAAFFTLLLAVFVFAASREMFGTIAAFLALTLFVFEPTLLAHGAVVTTDLGFSCFLFATVYFFYRYLKHPSLPRLGLTAIAAGLALASKHSAILVVPILIVLALVEVVRGPKTESSTNSRLGQTIHFGRAIVVIGLVSVAILWASYGFRLHPRPGASTDTRVAEYSSRLRHPFQAKMITKFAQWHLLPEPYLYGLADVGFTAEFSHTYLLGTVYPHGVWFYFPIAFAIKASLPWLILLALGLILLVLARNKPWRELLFILVPGLIYLAVAMSSGMNIGVRHILPIFPFLFVFAGWAGAELIQRQKRWAYVIAILLLFGAVSSLRVFPVYLSYANELWGGPSQTHRYLSDSNVDWGQQLKSIKKYLDSRQVKSCWFAYFADVVTEPAYYGIPCKPLTTIASVWLQPWHEVPPSIDGPVLISAGVLSGYEFGPGVLNPYDQFQNLRPTAVIENGVFVFDGHFDIPLASALNHDTRAQLLAQQKKLDEALVEAQTAVELAPNSLQVQAQLGFILMQLNRLDEARVPLEKALTLASTVKPEFQSGWIPGLKGALKR